MSKIDRVEEPSFGEKLPESDPRANQTTRFFRSIGVTVICILKEHIAPFCNWSEGNKNDFYMQIGRVWSHFLAGSNILTPSCYSVITEELGEVSRVSVKGCSRKTTPKTLRRLLKKNPIPFFYGK